jgi:hypothetical protein
MDTETYKGYDLRCYPDMTLVNCAIYSGTIELYRTSAAVGEEAREKARRWIDRRELSK